MVYTLVFCYFACDAGLIKKMSNTKQKNARRSISTVTIKNIKVTPETAPNDGTGRVKIRCRVFSGNDDAVIEGVKLDMRHTLFFKTRDFAADRANILKSSGEGDYEIELAIPYLSDTGRCRMPIVASDSAGAAGRQNCEVEIPYTRPEGMPDISSQEFVHLMERVGGASFSFGNSVEFLDDGRQALSRRLAMIREATQQINFQTYTLGHTGAAGEIIQALSAKAEQGAEVNVILNADSQIPTSPVSAVRLRFNRFLKELTKTLYEDIEKLPSLDEIIRRFQDLLGPGGGVNIVLFKGRSLSEKNAAATDDDAMVSHWLMKILREDIPEIRGIDALEKYLPSFAGPGGLPSVPLLDFAIHEKIMVADGKRAIVGGRNIEDPYFTRWRDLDLYLEGPVVKSIQDGFLANYREIAKPEKEDTQLRQLPSFTQRGDGVAALFIQSKPWSRQYRTLSTLACAMQAAVRRIYIYSQYIILPDCLLRDVLLDAAGRGVDVRIATNSLRTGREVHMAAGYFATLNYIERLHGAGIRVYEAKGEGDEQKPQPYLHTKQYLFDGKLAAAGSFNLSLRSSYIESENLVFILDPGICQRRESLFLEFLGKKCEEITPAHLSRYKTQHKTKVDLAAYLELLY